jgi:hypothetical protein
MNVEKGVSFIILVTGESLLLAAVTSSDAILHPESGIATEMGSTTSTSRPR